MIRIFLPLICAALGLAAASCSQSEGPFAPTETPASPHSGVHGSTAMASPAHAAQADGTTQNTPSADDTATGTDRSVPVIAQSSARSPALTPNQGSSADQAPSDDGALPADQPPHTDQASPADQEASTAAAPPPTTGAEAPATARASTATEGERRASTVIGMSVTSVDGSPIGKVQDIIFDPQGHVTHVVIAYDTEPGPEEIPDGKPRSRADGKLAAIPWDTALARMNGGKLVLDGTKLQSAPSFTADEWPNLQDPGWSAVADAYWRKVARPAVSAHRNAQIDSTARLRARPTRDGE